MAEGNGSALAALRESNEQLNRIVGALDDEALEEPSYCTEWNRAQVLSHLGSGAEIAGLNLAAARANSEPPDRSEFEAIWARWNARSPREMADRFLEADEAYLATLEAIPEPERETLRIPFFGGRILDVEGAALMRLGEHAVHSWDVAVSLDPTATIAPAPTALLVDVLPGRVARLNRGEKPASALLVHTAAPERDFLLSFGEEAELVPGDGAAEGELAIPAEGLIRLLYGRLDGEHTPAGTTTSGGADLDALRAAFPGF